MRYLGPLSVGLRRVILIPIVSLTSCDSTQNRPARERLGSASASEVSVTRAIDTTSSAVAVRSVQEFVEKCRRSVLGFGGTGSLELTRFQPGTALDKYFGTSNVEIEWQRGDSSVSSDSARIQLRQRRGLVYQTLTLSASKLSSEVAEEAAYKMHATKDSITVELGFSFRMSFARHQNEIRLVRIEDYTSHGE